MIFKSVFEDIWDYFFKPKQHELTKYKLVWVDGGEAIICADGFYSVGNHVTFYVFDENRLIKDVAWYPNVIDLIDHIEVYYEEEESNE